MNLLDQDPAELLSDLTPKQIEVLDRLLEHKTTKQIARELQIAPNTVDARLAAVREKWGTTDRKATARVYAHLQGAWGKPTCGFPPLDRDDLHRHGVERELPGSSLFTIADAHAQTSWFWEQGRRGVLETLDDRFGKVGRVVTIVALAIALAALVVLTLSMAETLSNLYLASESPNAT